MRGERKPGQEGVHLCTRGRDTGVIFVSLTSQGPGWSVKLFAGSQGSLMPPQGWPSTQTTRKPWEVPTQSLHGLSPAPNILPLQIHFFALGIAPSAGPLL